MKALTASHIDSLVQYHDNFISTGYTHLLPQGVILTPRRGLLPPSNSWPGGAAGGISFTNRLGWRYFFARHANLQPRRTIVWARNYRVHGRCADDNGLYLKPASTDNMERRSSRYGYKCNCIYLCYAALSIEAKSRSTTNHSPAQIPMKVNWCGWDKHVWCNSCSVSPFASFRGFRTRTETS